MQVSLNFVCVKHDTKFGMEGVLLYGETEYDAVGSNYFPTSK